ncbi:exocyst complex component, sec15 subunit [Macrolepiota fuliginosa MF-IS2]|uniref:Exocyst complex component SEC15 n=1 Tax=Macrolepiota fuliginosa MF-IS2 TaxID=1400762 RepID=A0A9P5XLJ4_9AGAR|nr:exocyst complex component, sec15 subunit [Macrolepiota fuliginosa MF-IS2]
MPPRRRPQFTQENIDQQLQQIHLLDPSSSSENLEQLGPIIKQIHSNRQQEAYLRTIQGLIESKDAEIEKICVDNYQDFISSVSTLFTVKSYTDKMKETIATLDTSVSQLGGGLVEKKRNLLQTKKTAANLDEAIDTLQACLRVLDVVNRVSEMVKEGKYWSALRSLEDIQSMPPTSISQTPFFQHLLSSLPSLRAQIKDAVTASMKQWLLEIRTVSAEVGKLAVEAMEARTRYWRTRREKDPLLRMSRVGSAVELVTYEKNEFNVLNNDKLKVDFKPLFECIHIYDTLGLLEELRSSYQADRKAQSDLILPTPLPLSSLPAFTQEISGFFIIESHVLESTGSFRSWRNVEELWDVVVSHLTTGIDNALRSENDPEVYLRVKENLLTFIMALEASAYSTTSLQNFILSLFERYVNLLEIHFGRRFESIIRQDDNQSMFMDGGAELQAVLDVVWISETERDDIKKTPLPQALPWSQSFYLCCQEIRSFIQKFYAFVEGVSRHHRDIDELLSKSLDNLFIKSISDAILQRLATTTTVPQIAQLSTNIEHFQVACQELERALTSLRSTQRGGLIRLSASKSFGLTLSRSLKRLTGLINSKLDQSFEFSLYNWTPQKRESAPNMQLDELVNWLTTVVDSLAIKEQYKDEAYKGAFEYIAETLMNCLTGRDIGMINENAISNILIDVDYLEDALKRIGRSHLVSVFMELRSTTSIPVNNAIQEFLIPASRQSLYPAVKQKRLQALLEKLARYGASQRDLAARELGERRRKEADAVGRLYPDRR